MRKIIGELISRKKPLYVLCGQSNMDGRGLVANLPNNLSGVIPNSLVWWDNEWQPLEAGVNASIDLEVGPIIELAYSLHREFPTRVNYFVIHAVGGTGIDYWTKPTGAGYNELYDRYFKAIASAPDEYDLKGFVYLQGEEDGNNEALSLAYEGKEQTLISDYKTTFGSAKFCNINISDVVTYAGNVQTAKRNNKLNGYSDSLFETEGQPLLGDNVHFNTQGQINIGRAIYWELKNR